MTTTTIKPLIVIKGKGSQARMLAFDTIAPATMQGEVSRVAMIAAISKALGASPTKDELTVAKQEYVVGRIAARLPTAEFPRGTGDDSAKRIAWARVLVTSYAMPNKKATKLPKGKTGWRSAIQQRVIRNAEEAWSKVLAETGHGAAKTQAQANAAKADKAKATRAPHHNAKGKGASSAPAHAELVKPAKPLSADDACGFLLNQSQTLLHYVKGNAGLLPLDFADAVHKFASAITAASAARTLAKGEAKANAKPAPIKVPGGLLVAVK